MTENDELAKTYTYDAFNRLSTYTVDGVTASYTYDGDNLRQSKTVNGSTVNHLLDGANVVADIRPDSTNIYVYGNGVELFKTGGQTSRYTKSYRGDVTAVTTGDTKTEYFYDAFGNKQTDTDTSTNPFEYCGEYFDDETRLIYLRNRYYDPTNGRFVTEDPARDGENWYVYCENNPIMFVDTNGLQPAIAHQFKKWCEDTFIGGILYEETRAGDLDWYYELCGFSRTDDGVFHAKKDAWQQYFGYNDFYDRIFDVGTSMKRRKISIDTKNENITIWLWKGDYLNLGAGAEVGIYSGEGYFKGCYTDCEIPMSIKVYYQGSEIVNYQETTWWCTGFNPNYHSVSADDLKVEVSLDLSNNSDIWDAAYEKYSGKATMGYQYRFNVESKKFFISW